MLALACDLFHTSGFVISPHPADPQNVKSMVRTRQADKSPYSNGFHTFAVDWSIGKITGERLGEAGVL